MLGSNTDFLVNKGTPRERYFLRVTDRMRTHLLRWCYALLLVKLGCLLWFDWQTQPLFKGLVLEHQC